MIDASVLYGDEDGLAAKIQAFCSTPAPTRSCSRPSAWAPIPTASQADCIRVLSDIARG